MGRALWEKHKSLLTTRVALSEGAGEGARENCHGPYANNARHSKTASNGPHAKIAFFSETTGNAPHAMRDRCTKTD